MKDRYVQGLLAGIAGWPPQFIFTMIMHSGFDLVKLRFLDFAGVLAFNHKPHDFWESLFSVLIVIAMMGALGILFAMAIKVIASPHPLLKGGIFGGVCWFTIHVIATLFKVKGIYGVTNFNTAVLNLIASVIWGIALGGVLLLLNRKYGANHI